ncbi:transposase, partial [Secundilactobacillus pentosiphilus]|uniref:transposase n=1 Tax=Secundilactobacillus pentosiphilus TaxID=1714682 RepID=UPI00117B1BE8
RPREYDLGAMMKLVLFAYTRGVFSSRRIETFAVENLTACWLTQEQMPTYRTICRFRISDELETLIHDGLDRLVDYLRRQNLIDDVTFIDGTKILANANKYSFVWRKNTVRFDQMNREAIQNILAEIKQAYGAAFVPEGTNLTLEMMDEVITRLEDRLDKLNKEIEQQPKLSPNP